MLPDSIMLGDIKPVLSTYLSDAVSMLDPGRIPDEKNIHDVRVLMKKSRATIKLLRTQMDRKSFIKEYNTFREVGRIMMLWRETSVHRKLLKGLRKKHGRLFSRLTSNEKVNSLLFSKEVENDNLDQFREQQENIIILLNKSFYRIRFMQLGNPDPSMVFKELARTYDNVTDCYLKARYFMKSTDLHTFRKRIKDFLFQLTFFRALNPKVIKSIEKQLDSLGQNLGKYNDHAVLIRNLDYKFTSGKNSDALDELIIIVKQEQDKYLSKVWPVAYKFFRPGKILTGILGFKSTDSNSYQLLANLLKP